MKEITFCKAQALLIDTLKKNNWEANEWLKIPWARNKSLNVKYYFKPQAIYKARFSDSFKESCSTGYDHKKVLQNDTLLNQFTMGEL